MNIQLKPVEVVRDEDGFFYHPEYSKLLDDLLGDREYPTNQEWEDFKKSLGIEIYRTWLESDASDEVIDRYFNGEIEVCAEWNPSRPDIEGDWFVISIHDSEEGAVCLWAKNIQGAQP